MTTDLLLVYSCT